MRLLDLDPEAARSLVEALSIEAGEQPFRARQVLAGIWRHGARSAVEISGLPLPFRKWLDERVRVSLLDHAHEARSSDGTTKYLWRLADGAEVESVAIPTGRRLTFCVSSQVGCAAKCAFCATGYLGLSRNLTAGEMADQVLAMRARLGCRQEALNVVFMGMGEPGYNMTAVLDSCRRLNSSETHGIGARRLTISTSGVVPAIHRLAEEPRQFRLAVSLHSGRQDVRAKLMSVARRFPLDELLAACTAYHAATGRLVTFEAAVIPGVNDSTADARALALAAGAVPSKVNLIPYNPVHEFSDMPCSDLDLRRFREALARWYRGEITVRQTRGRDVEGACGQLHRARTTAHG